MRKPLPFEDELAATCDPYTIFVTCSHLRTDSARAPDPRLRSTHGGLVGTWRQHAAHHLSPLYRATPDDPPTLIIHGDADRLVPIQQAELILDKLKAAGVETKLVVKKGAAHGWPDLWKDMSIVADWFDGHLKARKAQS